MKSRYKYIANGNGSTFQQLSTDEIIFHFYLRETLTMRHCRIQISDRVTLYTWDIFIYSYLRYILLLYFFFFFFQKNVPLRLAIRSKTITKRDFFLAVKDDKNTIARMHQYSSQIVHRRKMIYYQVHDFIRSINQQLHLIPSARFQVESCDRRVGWNNGYIFENILN